MHGLLVWLISKKTSGYYRNSGDYYQKACSARSVKAGFVWLRVKYCYHVITVLSDSSYLFLFTETDS